MKLSSLRRIALSAIVMLSAACGGRAVVAPTTPSTRAERSYDELMAAIAAMRASIASTPLPAYRAPGYLDPPSEGELATLGDRAVVISTRVDRILSLAEGSRSIFAAYVALDVEAERDDPTRGVSAATLRWGESMVRQGGWIARLVIDEFLPTISRDDPSYSRRIQGISRMSDGSHELFRGSIAIVRLQRGDLDGRRGIAIAWSEHAADFAKLWDLGRCLDVVAALNELAEAERDAAIMASTRTAIAQLRVCSGQPSSAAIR